MNQGDARDFINRYMERFEGIREFIAETIKATERDGYASTLYGRRRYLPDIQASGPRRMAAERAAINMPIQGTAADIMKLAMLDIDQKLQGDGLRSRMLLQVHDELIFEAPVSEVPALEELVKKAMVGVAELSVDLDVESKAGPNWEEMTPRS
jgi:DNA polymerase-1